MLWARGDLSLLDAPCVAIVGTRRATAYGERVARDLARCVARAGGTVISGLARGIDACAHAGALEAEGGTVAVLGTGLDVSYPVAHRALQREIGERGLLLSELEPEDRAHGGSFPMRNRIIAALAQVTVVVEAGVKSGALITASHALEQGRTVAAVPGQIDSPQAAGSNQLLRDGAQVLTDSADLLELLHLTPALHSASLPPDGPARAIWDALADGATDADTLASRTGLPSAHAMAAIAELEMLGLIECLLSGTIRRT